MHLGNWYSPLTMIALYSIWENKKIWAHDYSRTTVYFERISVVRGQFPRASGLNNCWSQNQFSCKNELQLSSLEFSASQKLTEDNTISLWYISITEGRREQESITTWKVSVFGVILVRIFQHTDWITPNKDTFCAVILKTPHIYVN